MTSVLTLKRIFKVLSGDYIDQDVRLFQKFTSLIVEHLRWTLNDNIANKTFITNFVEKTQKFYCNTSSIVAHQGCSTVYCTTFCESLLGRAMV